MGRLVSFLSSISFFFTITLIFLFVFVWQTGWGQSGEIYRSPWFIGLSMLLILNIGLCLFRRIRTARFHFIALHAGILLVIVGAVLNMATRFEAVMDLIQNQPVDTVRTEEGIYRIPCSLELLEFRIDYHRDPYLVLTVWLGEDYERVRVSKGLNFTLGPDRFEILEVFSDFALSKEVVFSRSPFWNNPALRLQVEREGKRQQRWIFVNFPGHDLGDSPWRAELELKDGEIKNYCSRVRIRDEEGESEARIAVNDPLSHRGYTFYQRSFNPSDPGVTVLTVKRERFLWLVYCGFLSLIAGVLSWLGWKHC